MAAQKIKIDLDATDSLDFERSIAIPEPSGKKSFFVAFTCRYRDRLGLAELFDGNIERAKTESKDAIAASAGLEALIELACAGVRKACADAIDAADVPGADGYVYDAGAELTNVARMFVAKAGQKSIVEQAKERVRVETDTIMAMVTGWNIDGFAFNEENVSKFLTKYPGAYKAVSDDYYVSVSQGRLGNSAR